MVEDHSISRFHNLLAKQKKVQTSTTIRLKKLSAHTSNRSMFQSFREVASRYYQRKNDERKETHYLLDGGKLVVPDADEATFLSTYAEYVSKGGRAYVVSRRSYPIFRMFFDLDVHLTDSPPIGWHERVGKYILGVVQELFDDADDQTLVICATDIKQDTKGGCECIKNGIHIHLPNLHVTRETACFIREAVIQKLCNHMGERPSPTGPTTWRDDVDAAVFEGNGLRLLYSRKMILCPACKSRGKEGCVTCLGVGKVDEGRAYKPLVRINNQFQTENIETCDMRSMLMETSIRSTRQEPSHALRLTPPCWMEIPELTLSRGSHDNKRQRRSIKGLNEGQQEFDSNIVGKEHVTSDAADKIKKWITRQAKAGLLPKQYSGVDIDAFTCMVSGSRCLAFIKLSSCFCSNIGREHATNTTYLEVDGRSQLCYQKCFCRCDTTEGRRARTASGKIMKCSEYRSTPCSSSELQELLFGTSLNMNHLMKPGLFELM